jgi:hypothetical protein
VDLRAIVRLEGLGQLKNPVALSESSSALPLPLIEKGG